MIRKIDKIHNESLQKTLQLKALLKCLESACYYNENLSIDEIRLFTEVLIQKILELEKSIGKFDVILFECIKQ